MDFGLSARKHREPDERAFTDHNLMHLVRNHAPVVDVGLFDNSREAITGADFEWWIGDGTSYIALLVQAKRMNHKGRFLELRRTIGASGPFQLLRLLNICKRGLAIRGGRDFVGFVPTYLFYVGPVADGLHGTAGAD